MTKLDFRKIGIVMLITAVLPYLLIPVLNWSSNWSGAVYVLIILSYILLCLYNLIRGSMMIWKLPFPKIGRQCCFVFLLVIYPALSWYWFFVCMACIYFIVH